jgi:hypothetical protein
MVNYVDDGSSKMLQGLPKVGPSRENVKLLPGGWPLYQFSSTLLNYISPCRMWAARSIKPAIRYMAYDVHISDSGSCSKPLQVPVLP